MVVTPLFVALSGTSDVLVIANAAVLTAFEAVWGTFYFLHGPFGALRSLWSDDKQHAMHPRAALNGLWWVCRMGTGCFASLQLIFAVVAAFLSDSTSDAAAERQAEAEAEAKAELRPGSNVSAEAETEAKAEDEAQAEPEAEPAAEVDPSTE
eukprot:2037939-Prymnesium_polylepis.1